MQFALTNLFLVAVSAVLYLVVRTLPRLGEEVVAIRQPSLIERLIISDIPHRFDMLVNAVMEKSFRRLKVVLLRFDNYLTAKIKKINTHNGIQKPKANFVEELNGPVEGFVEVSDNSGMDLLKSEE